VFKLESPHKNLDKIQRIFYNFGQKLSENQPQLAVWQAFLTSKKSKISINTDFLDVTISVLGDIDF
jgi:hypothetical protein